jgi:hypothetical protein
MKRWALVVVLLYGLVLIALTMPVCMAAFAPEFDLWTTAGVFALWPYWVWLGVMLLCQAGLLLVPVGVASRRPVSRRSLLAPVCVTGLLIGALVTGAALAVLETVLNRNTPRKGSLEAELYHVVIAIAIGIGIWVFWTIVFYRLSREKDPAGVVTRMCRYLLGGSIMELLVAIPTHIVARSKDYCCAGVMTFVGIVFGISVMLFSFGPGVFYLYVDRWRRLTAPRAADMEKG